MCPQTDQFDRKARSYERGYRANVADKFKPAIFAGLPENFAASDCSDLPTSNNLAQKGLAFLLDRSGNVGVRRPIVAPGSSPAGLLSRGGASVVAADDAAKPKEIPMTHSKSKRRATSGSKSKKTIVRQSAAPSTAHKAAHHSSHVRRQRPSEPARAQRTDSKQAQVIKMLRAPSGTTIAAMMTATGWQQHSVHGFLAGVIRKKFNLNLVSEAGDGGRVYRIKDGKARAQPSTQQAA
jgi:hypothetical protein